MNEFADKIEAIDVGIDEFGCCDSPTSYASRGLLCGQSFSEITYIHIHECEDVSVSRGGGSGGTQGGHSPPSFLQNFVYYRYI
jgi:hypothetical protein